MDKFTVVGRLGEGAHGVVLKARNNKTEEIVALKRVSVKRLDDKDRIATVLREINALRQVDSEFVVTLHDVFAHGLSYVLVFEYMPASLYEILRYAIDKPLSIAQIKSYMHMLLRGLKHLHELGIMHRDLKPANLLVGEEGELKIADLGLSRPMAKDGRQSYSHQVATRWYRAPELLYGSRHYDQGVDLWAVGCIFGELLNNSPVFPGENDIDQLCIVLHTLGTPDENIWPGVTELPDYNKITFPVTQTIPMEEVIPDAPDIAIDLVKKFLCYDSGKRISASEALVHTFFFSWPLPALLCDMPKPSKLKEQVHQPYDVDMPWNKLFEGLFKLDY